MRRCRRPHMEACLATPIRAVFLSSTLPMHLRSLKMQPVPPGRGLSEPTSSFLLIRAQFQPPARTLVLVESASKA